MTQNTIIFAALPKNPPIKDLTDLPFGRLKVLGYAGKHDKAHYWHCQCECGATVTISRGALTSGNTRSCGCLHREELRRRNLRHGQTDTPLHTVWMSLVSRCTVPTNKSYQRYGGRGIQVCAGFRVYETFFAVMGERPSVKYSLDRKDNNGHYSCGQCEECKANQWPLNVRWATAIEQNRNKRNNRVIVFQGVTATLAEHCERLHLNYGTVMSRITAYGWTETRALETPVE